MNKYTKPIAQVVELSVKESISLRTYEKSFGFGSTDVKLKTYASTKDSITTSVKKINK